MRYTLFKWVIIVKKLEIYDSQFIENVVKNEKKFILTGAVMISAIGLTACNDDVSLKSSYSTQMSTDFDSYDDVDQNCSMAMQNYLIAKDEYMRNESTKNRVSLVGSSRKMYDAILEMTDQKAINIINLDNSKRLIFDTDFENTRFYLVSKEDFDIDKSRNDYIIGDSYKVDGNLKDLAQALNGVSIYRGNGESEAWDTSINKFISASDSLYKEATNFIGKNFSLDGDKISVSKEKTVN